MAVAAPPPLKPNDVQPNDGVIRDARRRHSVRRTRTAGACLAIICGLGIAAWALGGGGAARSAKATRRSAPTGRSRTASFQVRLSPSLDGGTYGWCMAVVEVEVLGGGCATTPIASTPLAFTMSESSAKARRETIVVLADPQVAAILVGGHRRVSTFVPRTLPYGLRVARIVIPLRFRRSPAGRLVASAPADPSLLALDAQGRTIPGPTGLGSGGAISLSAHGPCALSDTGPADLKPEWSHVASAITPFAGTIIGRAFFSCIDTEYYLHNWPLDGAILLDASHPGRTPAPIPGLRAVTGEPGYFNGPGDFKGELTAVRRGDAWLVLAGGKDLEQRLEVLHHLTASVRL
jgi:hypothetical protein